MSLAAAEGSKRPIFAAGWHPLRRIGIARKWLLSRADHFAQKIAAIITSNRTPEHRADCKRKRGAVDVWACAVTAATYSGGEGQIRIVSPV